MKIILEITVKATGLGSKVAMAKAAHALLKKDYDGLIGPVERAFLYWAQDFDDLGEVVFDATAKVKEVK